MIGIIFNHDFRDEPYNQNEVKKAVKKLNQIAERNGEQLFLSFGKRRDLFFENDTEEYVIIQHTSDFSKSLKTELASAIRETLTLKKSEYKESLPVAVIFQKISDEDCFLF